MISKSTNREDYQHLPQSVGAMPKEYRAGYVSAKHSHQRAQLLHATSGVMEVKAGGRAWIVPPGRALWIPPDVAHETRMCGRVSLRTLYIDLNRSFLDAPTSTAFVRVSPLLRELVERACALPIDYETSGRAALTMELMLRELEWSGELGLPLTRSPDKRLKLVIDGILADPACSNTLSEWAALSRTSARTMARLCHRDLGISFTRMRRQLRLQAAIPRILSGEPVTTVAFDVGFETPSAFSTAFRRSLGASPSKYLTD